MFNLFKFAVFAGILSVAIFLTGCSTEGEGEYDADSETFGGYECTDDCSGHEAGYQWAEEKGIDNPDDCGGKSSSFIEGCQTYAEENS